MMENIPLLSVCLITYNHVNYIRQAIESVLMQKVNFTWELVIADDCSTDGTREILIEYREKYPDFIKLILQKKNIGAAKNWIELVSFPKSTYIACFEGDDYWTDKNKLQKQVDFLEQDSDFAMVHSDYDYLDEKSNIIIENYQKSNNIKNLSGNIFDYTFNETHIRTLTVCFRRDLLLEAIPILEYSITAGWIGGDLQIYLYLANLYKIGYLENSMGVYRRLEESTSISTSNVKMLDFVKSHLEIRLYILDLFKKDIHDYLLVIKDQMNRTLSLAFHTRNVGVFNYYIEYAIKESIPISKIYFLYRYIINNIMYYPIIYFLRFVFKMRSLNVRLKK